MPLTAELERLYDAHATALYAFALSLTQNGEETMDILQNIFLRLADRPSLLDGVRDERGFLLRLVHHAIVDGYRRRQTRETLATRLQAELHVFAPAPDPDEQCFRDALENALSTLPLEQRAVLHLKLWEGQTFEGIARILNISPNTAASRYRYGLDKLRQHLRPLYQELR